MTRWISAAVWLALTTLLTWTLNEPRGPLPALGKLLDPFGGFWANAETDRPFDDTPGEGKPLDLPGLHARVTVQFDQRMVPHIYAENLHDVFYTQGYLHARMRLFQMDLLTRFAAGTLSEFVGPAALDNDRMIRHYGLPWAAEKMLAAGQSDSITRVALDAYSAGANAWIEPLAYRDFPIEYKLLDAAPTPWAPIRSALLSRYMAWDLTSGGSDRDMSAVLAHLGAFHTADLFPDYPDEVDPIIPPGTKWDFKPLKLPEAPEENGVPVGIKRTLAPARRPGVGSNNWAVGPAKSASGNPILANDPHLRLTLPSIWFEQQLTAPGLNVYGVVVPGSPTVGIGFNDRIAWGFTNVGADFMDYFQLEFADASATTYRYGSEWRPVTSKIEVFRIKGQPDRTDTVRYTHFGPIPFFRPGDSLALAVRWLGYEPTNELKIFHTLATAKGYDDYVKAMETPFAFPQNMVFASADKDIALWISGRHILRWKGQGKFIGKGADPRYDWQGWIPSEQNPHVKNPPRGFVSSANQQSADETYPYYLDWDFESYERGARINRRLTAMTAATPDSLRLLQGDNYNLGAADVLPSLLAQLTPDSLPPGDRQAYEALTAWDRMATAQSTAQTVYDLWWRLLRRKIWSDDLPSLRWPSHHRTSLLIRKTPNAQWFDDRSTPQVETLRQLTRESFAWAVDSLTKLHGPFGEKWQWGKHKKHKLGHLLRLGGFGVDIPGDGGARIVNAASNPEGPSWRMVVEMTPQGPKAMGIYPGGQSGNPGSPYYDDFVATWVKTELAPLNFWPQPVEHSKVKTTLKLSPAPQR